MIEKRNFKGYFQSREIVKGGNSIFKSNWRFYICSFSDNSATILLHDKSTESIPIDSENRILVSGKWFSAEHWDH